MVKKDDDNRKHSSKKASGGGGCGGGGGVGTKGGGGTTATEDTYLSSHNSQIVHAPKQSIEIHTLQNKTKKARQTSS